MPTTYKHLKFIMEDLIEKANTPEDEKWTQERFDKEAPNYQFRSYYPAMFIPLLQLSTALLTEIISMWLIASQVTIMDVVMNFVALQIISEIDNMFSESSQDKNMKRYVDDNPDEYQPLIVKHLHENPSSERPWGNWFLLAFWRVLDFFYVCMYFYFFPFVAVILNFAIGVAVNCELVSPDDDSYCTVSPFGIGDQ